MLNAALDDPLRARSAGVQGAGPIVRLEDGRTRSKQERLRIGSADRGIDRLSGGRDQPVDFSRDRVTHRGRERTRFIPQRAQLAHELIDGDPRRMHRRNPRALAGHAGTASLPLVRDGYLVCPGRGADARLPVAGLGQDDWWLTDSGRAKEGLLDGMENPLGTLPVEERERSIAALEAAAPPRTDEEARAAGDPLDRSL